MLRSAVLFLQLLVVGLLMHTSQAQAEEAPPGSVIALILYDNTDLPAHAAIEKAVTGAFSAQRKVRLVDTADSAQSPPLIFKVNEQDIISVMSIDRPWHPQELMQMCVFANASFTPKCEDLSKQQAFLLVTYMPHKPPTHPALTHVDLTRVISALLPIKPALAVSWDTGAVTDPAEFLETAKLLTAGRLPIQNWIAIRMMVASNAKDYLFVTEGMQAFGYRQIEITFSPADGEAARDGAISLLHNSMDYLLRRKIASDDEPRITDDSGRTVTLTIEPSEYYSPPETTYRGRIVPTSAPSQP